MIGDYTEFLRMGRLLMLKSSDVARVDTKTEEAAAWRELAEKYLWAGARYIRIYAFAVSAVLPLSAMPLVLERNLEYVYKLYLIFILGTGCFAFYAFYPVLTIVSMIVRMSPDECREALRPVWASLELLSIVFGLALMSYLAIAWCDPNVYVALLCGAALWYIMPWIAYVAGHVGLYVKIRITQISVLFALALLSAMLTEGLPQYRWWFGRQIAQKTRPAEMLDVTQSWRHLQWFTQEGGYNVWYSVNNGKYRLYSAPGHDPWTNALLAPVRTESDRLQIEEALRQEAEEHLVQIAAMAERADAKRFLASGREGLKVATALVACGDLGSKKQMVGWLADCLNTAGVKADSSLFTDEFARSINLQSLEAGRLTVGKGFDVRRYCDQLLVCNYSIKTQRGLVAQELITVHVDVALFSVTVNNRELVDRFDYQASGVGFTEESALKLALDRLKDDVCKTASKWHD